MLFVLGQLPTCDAGVGVLVTRRPCRVCVSRTRLHYAPNSSIYQYGNQQAGLFRTYKLCGQIRHFDQIDIWTNIHCLTTPFERSNQTFCPNRYLDILGKMSAIQKLSIIPDAKIILVSPTRIPRVIVVGSSRFGDNRLVLLIGGFDDM